eukprot:s1703_g1.t3
MAGWTSEDDLEKLLAELAGEAPVTERSDVPRFGSKTSHRSANGATSSNSANSSRRSSLKSLDSVTSLLEKLDRPHGERGKGQRKTSKEVEALPEVSGLKEGHQTEASLRSRQAEQHNATREQAPGKVLPATAKAAHDKDEEAQRELAAERASSEKAREQRVLQTEASRSRQAEQHNATREQVLPATAKAAHDKDEEAQRELAEERASSEKAKQELSRLREELQTEASLRSRQAEQHNATREQVQQEVKCLQEELQTAETSLHTQRAELLAASTREQVLLAATPKSENSREEAPKSLWARFRRDLSPIVSKDSQKAQQELCRLKEQLRTAEANVHSQRAELQEASKREQAQQELTRLTVESGLPSESVMSVAAGDHMGVRSLEHTQQCDSVAMEAVDMVWLSLAPEAAVEELALMVLQVLVGYTDDIDLVVVDTKIFGVKLVFAVHQIDLFSSVYFSQSESGNVRVFSEEEQVVFLEVLQDVPVTCDFDFHIGQLPLGRDSEHLRMALW